MKDYRELKVYDAPGANYKYTPAIIMKGKWLEEMGFEKGTQFSVKCEIGKLTLTKVDVQLA